MPAPLASAAPSGAQLSTKAGWIHEGFYLRFSLGLNYGVGSVQTDRLSAPDLTLTGVGGDAELWAGFTPWPSVVIGPLLGLSGMRSSRAKLAGTRVAAGATSAMAGLFLDAFPNPRRGEHFGGALGLVALNEASDSGEASFEGGGLGFSVFCGKDWWVSRHWSLGGLLRLGGALARQTRDEAGRTVTKQGIQYSAALLGSVLYQ